MIGVSKKLIHILFLSFWLIALTAPTIITIIDDSSLVVNNINEEEQQEQYKKNSENVKFITCDFLYLLYISDKKNISYINRTSLNNSMHTSKIILPPPEEFPI